LSERLNHVFARRAHQEPSHRSMGWMTYVGWLLAGGVIIGSAFAVVHVSMQILSLNHAEVGDLMHSTGATLLRVVCALLIGAAWAIPAGVAIGSSPRVARIAQPIVQIAAAVPATAFFPILLLLLDNSGYGLGLAPIALMLLGTQWYILFNVIAGAMSIPGDLKEASHVFGFRKLQRWRTLILPGIFPALVTGLVTAAGGAWNASIMAEYCHFKGRIFQATGLGSLISRAADSGNFEQLLMATVVLSVIVVITNRLLWRPLYGLVETRFRLDS
jgi:NitT/TauT family transport system permease protein